MGSISAVGAFVEAYGGAIAAGAAAAGAAATAIESREAGVAADKQARQKARVEADKATQQQISMRQNMLRALASQNAGTQGAATGAGLRASYVRQLTEGQNDLLVSKANSSAQVSLLDQQGENLAQAGTFDALKDLGQGAGSAAGLLRKGG